MEAAVPAPAESFEAYDIESAGFAGCFPCRWATVLPMQIRPFIPGTWHVIQDPTHLSLIVGRVCFIFIIGVELFDAARGLLSLHFFTWARVVCVTIMALSIFMYMGRIIGGYDQGIVERERKIKEQRQGLLDGYRDLMKDIDGVLNRAKESTQSLAENEFNSKRQDFLRFVQRMEDRFDRAVQMGSEAQRVETFVNFKKFCVMWLKVYEECSLDPINCPFRLVDTSQLDACRTIPELCWRIKEDVKNQDVYFSKQIEDGASTLKDKREAISRLSLETEPVAWSSNAGTNVEIELSTQLSRPAHGSGPNPWSNSGESDGELSDVEEQAGSARQVRAARSSAGLPKAPCTWIKLSRSGVGLGPFNCCDGLFPHRLRCLFCHVAVLSPTHRDLLLAFFLNIALVVVCLIDLRGKNLSPDRKWSKWILGPSLGLLQAVMMLLAYFEQLDTLQRMERELIELGAERESLQGKKEEMTQYWEQVQAITDIWVHRVTPRLFLYKEVQACLEDLRRPEDFNTGLMHINRGLEALEDRLPELIHWKADGKISQADKKSFDKAVKKLSTNPEDLESVATSLHNLVTVQRAIPMG